MPITTVEAAERKAKKQKATRRAIFMKKVLNFSFVKQAIRKAREGKDNVEREKESIIRRSNRYMREADTERRNRMAAEAEIAILKKRLGDVGREHVSSVSLGTQASLARMHTNEIKCSMFSV